MRELYLRAVFTTPYLDSKPAEYQGHVLPSHFTATFYFLDNGNSKVTPNNHKNFKVTWSAELLVRVTEAETIEVIRTSVLGARTYKGHTVFTTKVFDPDAYGSIHAGHYLQLSNYRTRITVMAVTTVIQSHVYKETKTGGHSWTVADNVPKTEAELQAVGKAVAKQSYTKLDHTFYKEFTRIYNEALEQTGKPIQVLMQSLGKSEKRVQAYATEARNLGLLNDDDPRRKPRRKVSKVRTPITRKGK